MLNDTQRQYIQLYEQQEHPLLYAAPWWLDAVCQKQWQALDVSQNPSVIHAFLPYYKTRIRGMSAIITPPATQWISILRDEPGQSAVKENWFSSLPRVSILDLSIKDLPVYSGENHLYNLTTRYSYILAFADTFEKMTAGYNEGLKRNLRQAETHFTIAESEDVSSFIALCKNTYSQRSMRAPQWIEHTVPVLVSELAKRNRGRMKFITEKDQPVAAILTGWDNGMDYYIAGGRMPTEAGSSAHSLLLHDAVREAHAKGHGFDFEGSMVPGIATFFQSFGAKPFSYFQFKKYRGFGHIWHWLR